MSSYKRIYASFLLLIFSAVAFHDLLPHAHHDHDDSPAHTDHHEDHHEHDYEGVLAVVGHLLHLHQHTHNDCEIDVCPETPMVKRTDKDNPNTFNATSTLNEGVQNIETGNNTGSYIPTYDINALLRGISSRGPPPDDC